jgi:hypothetical protein
MCAVALSVGSYGHKASSGVCFANRRASQREFPPPSLLARRTTSGAGVDSERERGVHARYALLGNRSALGIRRPGHRGRTVPFGPPMALGANLWKAPASS